MSQRHVERPRTSRLRHLRLSLCLSLLAAGGCNSLFNGFLDPTQVGRFKDEPVTTELRRSISVADEPLTEIEAQEPQPEDLEVPKGDYVLGPRDTIEINIRNYYGEGQALLERRSISDEGYITLPQIDEPIKAAGRTVLQLEQDLEKLIEEKGILVSPFNDATVVVTEARGLSYNVMGAFSAPRQYFIPRPDFRLLDAIAMAGDIAPIGGPQAPLVRNLYVFRRAAQGPSDEAEESDSAESAAGERGAEEAGFGNLEASDAAGAGDYPGSQAQPLEDEVVGPDMSGHWIYVNGEWKFVKPEAPPTAPRPETAPATRAAEAEPEQVEDWESLLEEEALGRTIVVPLAKLRSGDPRYNIVIRPGDTIYVPQPMQGEFYMLGNVLRPGVYSLTGREITIRQALAAAGGLAPLADPSRCELVRRLGGDQEQVISIDIDRILAGKDPDIILKPDDVINVGTNAAAPFLAVIRNAFRATYGFGFVYDRNFADIDSFNVQTNPKDRRRAERAALGLPF